MHSIRRGEMMRQSNQKEEPNLAELLELTLVENDKLRSAIDTLNGTMKEFVSMIKTAADAPEQQFGDKLDVLIKHNEDIARGILLMLELNREHLPQIAQSVRNYQKPMTQSHSAVQPPKTPLPRKNESDFNF